MHISRLDATGFRCFGPEAVTISFSPDLTVLVGANGSGKTAAMHALLRLFGVSKDQRSVVRSDFHFAPNEDPDQVTSKQLCLDVVLKFPELTDGADAAGSIPSVFNHMCCAVPGDSPVCRIRLEATWTQDGTPEGAVEERMYWITTLSEVPFGEEESGEDKQKQRMPPAERGLIQVHYVPATRDGAALTRNALGHMTSRLIRAISWREETKNSVKELSETSKKTFDAEPGITRIVNELKKIWKRLNASELDAQPSLSPISREFEEVINRITITFRPTEDGRDRSVDQLSDGQKSLFYLALSATVFDVEQAVLQEARNNQETGFLGDKLHSPALTIFALEEPENHLAPFFLSRIVRHLRKLVGSHHAMAVFSSHSPGVLGRIDPKEVRHFRLESNTRRALVSRIALPKDNEEAAKYVREAVIAYPELYFARFVILVEGDSEQIVLPKLAEAMDLPIDPSFVAVVPLGGRHVNHFWWLLNQLGIPFFTLLDLDLGRAGGGLGRIKYASNKLLESGSVVNGELNDRCHEFLKDTTLPPFEESQCQQIESWCNWLESKGVYYSAALDLDMMMLQAFPAEYQEKEAGERGPQSEEVDSSVINAVLGTGGYGEAIFSAETINPVKPLLPWYRYRFLTKSKPAAHIQALSRISKEDLREKAPPVLKRLLEEVANTLHIEAES
ncbi:MAG: AAA family ATPase [Magnetococcales bacterium]|nr:AAA family ATPase [Magnetococcales bacterium]